MQSTANMEHLWERKKVTIVSISGNEGRFAQARVNVKGGLRVVSVYFWHSEVWTEVPCLHFDCDLYEYNIECWASEVVGQDWSSEVAALFLED